MFIIMRLKDNTIREVPRAIPSNLWKSVAYNKNSSNYGTLSARTPTQRYNNANDNSFSNNFTSPVGLNITGNNAVPINVTGGSSAIPVNMTGGSITINKTGGSVVSVNKTGNNNMLMSSNPRFNNNTYDNSMNNYNSQSLLSNQSSTQSLNSGYSNEYAISQQEKEKYDPLFNKLDTMGNQYVTGEQSMDFFLKSGLSTPELAQIWELADMNKTGRLSREEFYIAMHLIRQTKSGMKLPTTLPSVLIPPSLRKGSTSSIGASSSQYNQQPLSATFSNTSKVGSDTLLNSFDSPSSKFTNTSSNDNLGYGSLRSAGGTVEKEVNQLKSEIQQMEGNITSMTNDKQISRNQRDQLEQELKELVSKKNDLSMKLTQLKISYDSENLMLNDLKTTFAKENQSREAAQAECNQLEEMVKKLRNEKMFIEHDIERSKEEVTQLNNRIKELKAEYNTLKDEVDRLSAEQKHQNDMLNVTRQMTMAEQQKVEQLKQDKMSLQVSIMNSQKELDKASAERSGSVQVKQDSKIVNPFEQEDEADFFSNSPSKPAKVKSNFDDAFDTLSARATSINSGRFEASFDDAFGTPNTAKQDKNQVNAFDDAFQIADGNEVSSPSQAPANAFDDAFQTQEAKAFDDPFSKHAQSIPNAFGDAFNEPPKSGSVAEDPFASSANLSNLPSKSANAFDDAFSVPNSANKESSNANAFDDAFSVPNSANKESGNANAFDDAFSDANSPFTNANGFDNAFNNANTNTSQQPAQEEFTADFSNAFANNNNVEDPFKAADEAAPSQTQNQDQAGFSFNHAVNSAQEDAFNFDNTPVSAPGKDQAGFSFDNAFDAAAATATAAVPANDPFKVSNAEEEEEDEDEDEEEVESSIGEEQPIQQDEEITNPFGDDQNIDDDEDYMNEDQNSSEVASEQPISMPMPMPMPAAVPEQPQEQPSQEQPQQSSQLPPEEPISMPMQMPMPVQEVSSPQVPEQQEQQEQPASAPVVEEQPVEQTQTPVEIPISEEEQQQQQQQQPHQQEEVIEEVIYEEVFYEDIPPEEQAQAQATQEKPQESNAEAVPAPEQQTIQEQPQQTDIPVSSDNPFENESNVFGDENAFNDDSAFETDFNSAFQNMTVSNEAPNPENTESKENEGNMVKSLSNNSIKIDNLDMDKEFQDFVNNSGFEKTESTEPSAVAQNVNDNVNSSFDEEFETGFDENDFNFDTTFDNKNVSLNTNNVNANANTATNPAENGDAFDAFAEQATAHFETNFDDAFNFDNFYDKKNDQNKQQSDAFMDEAFGGSTAVTPATGDSGNAFANFDNNFNDFGGGDPFAAFDADANSNTNAKANAGTNVTATPTSATNPTTDANEAPAN